MWEMSCRHDCIESARKTFIILFIFSLGLEMLYYYKVLIKNKSFIPWPFSHFCLNTSTQVYYFSLFCSDKMPRPKQLAEGGVYLDFWFQRGKIPLPP